VSPMGKSKKKEDKLPEAPELKQVLGKVNNDVRAKWANELSPEERAGPVSIIMFTWVTRLFQWATKKRKKYKQELEQEDLFNLPKIDGTEVISDKFAKVWSKKFNAQGGQVLTSNEASALLTTSIWSVIGSRMIRAGVLKFINSCVQFVYPFLIDQLIKFAGAVQSEGAGDVALWHGYAFAIGYGLAMVAKAITENAYFFMSFRSGWQTRSIVSTEVYRKSLRLSSSARQSKTLGEIVNLMQLDSTKLEMFLAMSFHVLWDGIFQIIGYIVILYTFIGWATFVGLGVMVVAVPIQGLVFSKLLGINRKMVKVTDDRVKLTNEILQGIQGIKMAGWEYNYLDVVNKLRGSEIKYIRRTAYLNSFSIAMMTALPTFTAVAALTTYAFVNDGDIDAETLFASITAFNQLRFPLMFYPNALNQLAMAKVSRKRIADFLALDEITPRNAQDQSLLEDGASNASESTRGTSGVVVQITDGDFAWARSSAEEEKLQAKRDKKKTTKKKKKAKASADVEAGLELPEESRLALKNINININAGELCAIVGPVGSGKSSLVNAILGEMHTVHGSSSLHGNVAYAAQSAWILNATIRDNIVFGETFDEKRYIKVVKACQLLHDFEILSDGDQTMIGERGINLSGGQKQRISVARTAYSTKEIVILDDPLSALDPEVARNMFEKCIMSLLKDRTRILVTNQLNFLQQCDKVLVLEANDSGPGEIVEQGTYQSLLTSGLDFSKLMAKYNGSEDSSASASSEAGSTPISPGDLKLDGEEDEDEDRRPLSSSMIEDETRDALQANAGKDIMQVEERATGAVKLSEYLNYIKAGGGYCVGLIVFFVFILNQATQVGNTFWVQVWSEDADPLDPDVEPYANQEFEFYVKGLAVAALLLGFTGYCRGLAVYLMGLQASKKLHSRLLDSVLHAPMSFFDTTPIGRITSRFSKDIYLIDIQVPQFMSFFLFTVMFVIFSLGSISFTTPLFLIAVPFLGVIYLKFLQYYRPLARDTKRLESISRSPVYAHFSETLGGLSTVRAFGLTESFKHTNATKVDHNLRSWYSVKSIERWLALRLEMMGACISILAASLATFGAIEGQLSKGAVGFSLSFTISLTNLLNQTVRMFAELEAGMNSVERVVHYSTGIEQEAPYESKRTPPKDWPQEGKIVISDLRMRYRKDTPLVLKGVNLTIEGGMRVGVVGRTGSGKSSLLLCFLRLVEPELNTSGEGSIFIDGIDISKIGLHELRTKVSIVPQAPVMFSGTIRNNVDPFRKYSDEAIWSALDEVEMKGPIEEAGGLEGEVAEYGENFSQGQRQLLCLARSVLAQARVLLLDEATSSVDYATDALIQTTIRNSFPNATICTIAHRLNTVIDSDRILVLDSGVVAEYDSPKTLLEQPDSVFTSMVSELGATQAAQLKGITQQL